MSIILSRNFKSSLVLFSMSILLAGSILPMWQQVVWADSLQSQIEALQNENSTNREALNNLEEQAATYEDAIAKLQSQIDSIQAAIVANQAKQLDLNNQIAAAQKEIDQQRAILAEDVKAMYVDGTPSLLESLASSKDFNEFIDKQEYRSRVQNKLQDTLKQIALLQRQLQEQKAQVEQLISEQQVQQTMLDGDRAKQQQLLDMNNAERADFNAKISENSQRVAQLRAEQAALIRTAGGGARVVANSGNDSYPSPWRDYPLDTFLDYWGMFSRECVSYTAWKVNEAYGNMPYWGGIGNANQWDDNARRMGIPTGNTPKPGSVGIINGGKWGHAVWVEAVEGNQVLVSEYNYDWAGGFRRAYYPASSFVYIYFGEW